jgi:hypothetical protein
MKPQPLGKSTHTLVKISGIVATTSRVNAGIEAKTHHDIETCDQSNRIDHGTAILNSHISGSDYGP